MSLIICPECGTKISDKAKVCPNCGYTTDNGIIPISNCGVRYEYIPRFQFDSEENGVCDSRFFAVDDNKNLYNTLGKYDSIKRVAPALADAIVKLAQGDSTYIVNIDPEIKRMIKEGIYKFTMTKDGKMLASLRDAKGFAKNLDITKVSNISNITGSVANLGMYMNMQEIIKEIANLHNEILSIHYELQNDRLALAEGASDMLLIAVNIEDARLRQIATLNAISAATTAKRTLMRNFTNNLKYILDNSNKNTLEIMMDMKKQKGLAVKAQEAFKTLIYLTNSVQVECQGLASLGEYDASKESLSLFRSFILDNKLNDPDTLILLNENCKGNNIDLVDNFNSIADKIELLDNAPLLGNNIGRIEGGVH